MAKAWSSQPRPCIVVEGEGRTSGQSLPCGLFWLLFADIRVILTALRNTVSALKLLNYKNCQVRKKERQPTQRPIETRSGNRKAMAVAVACAAPFPLRTSFRFYLINLIVPALVLFDVIDGQRTGWEEKYSYGYHGDDGNAFGGTGAGEKYGPQFTTGDTVGCCVDFMDGTSCPKSTVCINTQAQEQEGPPLLACNSERERARERARERERE